MKVVFLRHGESEWNRENRFTGWTDVDLSAKGTEEAKEAGRLLLAGGFDFDLAYTSYLRRAIRTLDLVLDKCDRLWIPVEKSWRLNERHYGALQGLDKGETAAKFGEDQVKVWRRSYATPPPPLDPADPRNPALEARYRDVDPTLLPLTESLKETVARALPYWTGTILPQVAAGRRVLVVAHGNSLRALVKHLDGLTEEQVVALDLPTGIPLVYEFDAAMRVVGHEYLGDPERLKAALDKVAAQGKAKGPG